MSKEEEKMDINTEEEEEDIDICGETGREFDATMSDEFMGCRKKFDEGDTCMLGNTSFCEECYSKYEEKYYSLTNEN